MQALGEGGEGAGGDGSGARITSLCGQSTVTVSRVIVQAIAEPGRWLCALGCWERLGGDRDQGGAPLDRVVV